ncbi:unnamed protein product [Lactuca saligna]|uniref:Uncharacterized protein n=1 Tax=Lactuca saligna TaxID=75948 RepID=A0AA36E4E5_LACSI|nr:unnamed protein product [Lactuca saligna]
MLLLTLTFYSFALDPNYTTNVQTENHEYYRIKLPHIWDISSKNMKIVGKPPILSRNKKLVYVPHPYKLRLILAHDEEAYNVDRRDIIPIPSLSSMIINVAPSNGDMHITKRMENWIANPYTVEPSDSEKEYDENDDKDNEEGVDDEEQADDEDDT